MSKVVFVLGAGASRDCGGPLMSDFLDIAQNLLATGAVNSVKADFERVFKAVGGLQQVHSKSQIDLYNIESIFTALELGKVIKKFPSLENGEIDETIRSLKTLIVATLEQRIKFSRNSDGYLRAPSTYTSFVELLAQLEERSPALSSAIITFNYDIALDYAMQQRGIAINYALDSSKSGGTHLLKLHGSVNWGVAIEEQRKHVQAYDLSPIVRHREIYRDSGPIALPIGSKLQEFLPGVEKEPVIVPPSWNKADYHRDLTDVWAAAASHLAEAENIIVIGYSLPETDSFFRHLYALGSASEQPLRRFMVFDPSGQDGVVDRRFRGLLGPGAEARYEFHSLTFKDSLESLRNVFEIKAKAVRMEIFG